MKHLSENINGQEKVFMKKNDKNFYVKKNYYFKMFKLCREFWSLRSPLKKICFKNARFVADDGLEKWKCAHCETYFAMSELNCDHIDPISLEPTSLEEFKIAIERLESSALQVLCRKKCHKLKTKDEKNSKLKKFYLETIEKSGIHNIDFLVSLDIKKIKKIYALTIKLKKSESEKEKNKFTKKINSIFQSL